MTTFHQWRESPWTNHPPIRWLSWPDQPMRGPHNLQQPIRIPHSDIPGYNTLIGHLGHFIKYREHDLSWEGPAHNEHWIRGWWVGIISWVLLSYNPPRGILRLIPPDPASIWTSFVLHCSLKVSSASEDKYNVMLRLHYQMFHLACGGKCCSSSSSIPVCTSLKYY